MIKRSKLRKENALGTNEFHEVFNARSSARQHINRLCALSEHELIAVLNMIRARRVRLPGYSSHKSLKIVMRAVTKRFP